MFPPATLFTSHTKHPPPQKLPIGTSIPPLQCSVINVSIAHIKADENESINFQSADAINSHSNHLTVWHCIDRNLAC